MAEEKKKKGFFSAIKESMNKSGGCCGSGETCGAAPDTSEGKEKKKTPSKVVDCAMGLPGLYILGNDQDRIHLSELR